MIFLIPLDSCLWTLPFFAAAMTMNRSEVVVEDAAPACWMLRRAMMTLRCATRDRCERLKTADTFSKITPEALTVKNLGR